MASELPKIKQAVKVVKKVTYTPGLTKVTFVLTADDGTVSSYTAKTFSSEITPSAEAAYRAAWRNLADLLEAKHD